MASCVFHACSGVLQWNLMAIPPFWPVQTSDHQLSWWHPSGAHNPHFSIFFGYYGWSSVFLFQSSHKYEPETDWEGSEWQKWALPIMLHQPVAVEGCSLNSFLKRCFGVGVVLRNVDGVAILSTAEHKRVLESVLNPYQLDISTV